MLVAMFFVDILALIILFLIKKSISFLFEELTLGACILESGPLSVNASSAFCERY